MSNIRIDPDLLYGYRDQINTLSNNVRDMSSKARTLSYSLSFIEAQKLHRNEYSAMLIIKLDRCASYCNGVADEFNQLEDYLCSQNPLDFTPPPATLADFIYEASQAVGCAVSTGIKEISAIAEQFYEDHKQLCEMVKAAIKFGLAVCTIAAGVAACFVPGLQVFGILAIIAGFNDGFNAGVDFAYASAGNFNMIGQTNLLKGTAMWAGGAVGEMLGNRQMGEFLGSTAFYAFEGASTIAIAACGVGLVKAAPKATNVVSKMWNVVKTGKQVVDNYVVTPYKATVEPIRKGINSGKAIMERSQNICRDTSWNGYVKFAGE